MKHHLRMLGIVALAICCLAVPVSQATAQCASGICHAPGYVQPHVVAPVIASPAFHAVVPIRQHFLPGRRIPVAMKPVCYGGICGPPIYRPPAYQATRSFGISFHRQYTQRPAYPIRW